MRRGSSASTATVASNMRADVGNAALTVHRARARNGTHPGTDEVNERLAVALDPPSRMAALEVQQNQRRLERAREAAKSRESRPLAATEDDTVDADGNLILLRDAKARRRQKGRSPALPSGLVAQTPAISGGHAVPRPFTPSADAAADLANPLAGFDEHFAGAFRPLSVCSHARSSRATTPAVNMRRSAAGADDDTEADEPSVPLNPAGGRARSSTPSAALVAAAQRRKDTEVLKQRVAVEASSRRKEARAYIRNVTATLRHDDGLREAFSDRVLQEVRRRARGGSANTSPTRSGSPPNPPSRAGSPGTPALVERDDPVDHDGLENLPHNLRLRKHESVADAARRRKEAAEQQRVIHRERCEKAYDAKQNMLLDDYLRHEHDLEVTRGEKFSRPRFFLAAISVVVAAKTMGTIVDRGRKTRTYDFAASLVQRDPSSATLGAGRRGSKKPPSDSFSASRRRATLLPGAGSLRSPGPPPPAEDSNDPDESVLGVHRRKFWAVERRQEEQKELEVTPELQQLVQNLGPQFRLALHLFSKRRKTAAIELMRDFLTRIKESARVRLHIKLYLGHVRLIIGRWKAAYAREQERVKSVTMQMDFYYAERMRYDRDICAMADRELKSRERSVAKANLQKRTTHAHAETVLSPLRDKRRKTAIAVVAGDLLAKDGGDVTPTFTPRRAATRSPRKAADSMTELQLARVIAAPFMTPMPFGKRLGNDPANACMAGRATLKALRTDRITWALPEHTKSFVVRYLIARERIAFADKISAWAAAMNDSHAKLDNIVFAAQISTGITQEKLKQEVEAWEFPRMPRRQVFLRPNEMRFWVHVAVLLYNQERRTSLENGVRTDKYLDPAAMETTYNARNVLLVLKKSVAALGEKLGDIRAGYFADPTFPVDVAIPVVPNHLLHPNARKAE